MNLRPGQLPSLCPVGRFVLSSVTSRWNRLAVDAQTPTSVRRGRKALHSAQKQAVGEHVRALGPPHPHGSPSDVPPGGEVLQSGRAVLPGQVLVELVLQGVQAVAVAGAGAELGDVEAGGVGHVDHERVGEDHQVVLLEEEEDTGSPQLILTETGSLFYLCQFIMGVNN